MSSSDKKHRTIQTKPVIVQLTPRQQTDYFISRLDYLHRLRLFFNRFIEFLDKDIYKTFLGKLENANFNQSV